MAQYIDKSALVAEIERRIKVLQNNPYENHKTICHLDSLKQSINTLEVKEVDLDESLTSFMSRYAYENDDEYPSAIDIAKNFFELGLKIVQKEE